MATALITPHFESLSPTGPFDDVALDRQNKFGDLYGREVCVHVIRPDMHFSGVALGAKLDAVGDALDLTLVAAATKSAAGGGR